MPKGQTEKREFYRINDVIGLSYKILNSTQPELTIAENPGFEVKTLLAEIDKELNQITNTLWHENPITAKALGLLNRKLSIIAAETMGEGDEKSIESYEQLMVNISGCGIAFDCMEKLHIGTPLLLSIMLKPANTVINLRGKVVRLQARRAGAKKPFWVRMQFDKNNAASQEQLIQHIVQKQCAQIGYRSKREEQEDEPSN